MITVTAVWTIDDEKCRESVNFTDSEAARQYANGMRSQYAHYGVKVRIRKTR